MSIAIWQSPLFSISSHIRHEANRLIVSNCLTFRILTFWLYLYRIEINQSKRQVLIASRRFWFFSTIQEIPFSELSYIKYEFSDMGTDWGLSGDGGIGRQDSIEQYQVSIVTRQHQYLKVANFFGEGAVYTGYFGSLVGDDEFVDVEGTQQTESLQFVEFLCQYTRLPLGRPNSKADEDGLTK